jgi:hypothetical protein
MGILIISLSLAFIMMLAADAIKTIDRRYTK